MPNNRSRENSDFSLFNAMTDEELEEFLRLDEQTTKGSESDSKEILYIMEVLAERNKNCFSAGKSAEEAFESFQKNYMPHEDSVEPTERNPELEVMNRRPRQWMRRLTAAAAAIAVVVVCSVTASAFGFDIWETIVKWTQETLHLGSGSDVGVFSEAEKDTSLQDVLLDYNITELLAPTWFPEGYELSDIITDETPMRLIIFAVYQNGQKEIQVHIKGYLNGDPQQVERSDSLIETYESNGITYYIFSNYDQLRAVWTTGIYECYISGELTVEEIKSMIDSINKE